MSSLGRTVWSGSMSLLSLASYPGPAAAPPASSDPSAAADLGSDTDSETWSCAGSLHSDSPLGKSSSEPPTQRPRGGAGRRRRLSLSDSSSGGGLGLSLDLASLEREGEAACSAAVWTWGAGKRGQLGQGDTLARNQPSHVPVPGESHVVKLSAGTQHCLALTHAGAVWGWGDNSRGQAVYTDTGAVVSSPHQVTLQPGEMAADIACAGHVSALLTTSLRCYVLGNIAGRSTVRMQVVDLASDLGLGPDTVPGGLHMTAGDCIVSCRAVDPHFTELCGQEKVLAVKVSQVLGLLRKVAARCGEQQLQQVADQASSLHRALARCLDITLTLAGGSWQLCGVLCNIKQLTRCLAR